MFLGTIVLFLRRGRRRTNLQETRSDPHPYSVLSASIGEIEAARRAGMIAATNAQSASDPAAMVSAGIPERHSIELRRKQAPCPDGERHAQHEPDDHARERPAQDQARDLERVGTERHADPELVGPLRNRIGGDPVESDCREYNATTPKSPARVATARS